MQDSSWKFTREEDLTYARRDDLANLERLVRQPGVTVLVGPPKRGKSSVVRALAESLQAHSPSIPEDDPGQMLVGYFEAQAPGDAIPAAVADLYRRWLSDEQAAKDLKKRLRKITPDGRVGVPPGAISGAAALLGLGSAALGAPGLGILASLVSLGDSTLEFADRKKSTQGPASTPIPGLAPADAKGLLRLASDESGRDVLVIVDQWESAAKDKAPRRDISTLADAARHSSEWPHAHILLVTRPEDPGLGEIERLLKEHPGRINFLTLPALDFAGSPKEAAAVLAHLRGQQPYLRGLEDREILAAIDGEPAVVDRLLHADPPTSMTSSAAIRAIAKEARAMVYRELDGLPVLPDAERTMAITLALCPELSEEDWEAVGPILSEGIGSATVDQLARRRLLTRAWPPSWGHKTRHEAALSILCNEENGCPNQVQDSQKALAFALAARVPRSLADPFKAMPDFVPILRVLAFLHRFPAPSAQPPGLGLHVSARILLQGSTSADEAQTLLATAQSDLGAGQALVAMAISYTLSHEVLGAGRRPPSEAKRRPDHDQLLRALQALASKHDGDALVRRYLARTLCDDVRYEREPGRSAASLHGLRALYSKHGGDREVQHNLALVLLEAVNVAETLEQRNKVLDDLRAFHRPHAGNAWVREALADGLYNTFCTALDEKKPDDAKALLEELRVLSRENPDEIVLRWNLSMALVNMGVADASQHGTLVEELRDICSLHHSDAKIRSSLATGLSNAIVLYTQSGQGLRQRDQWLRELRKLWVQHAGDATIQFQMTRALIATTTKGKNSVS